MLEELYGIEVSATTISAITDKVWPLVEAWQNRLLDRLCIRLFTWTPFTSNCVVAARL